MLTRRPFNPFGAFVPAFLLGMALFSNLQAQQDAAAPPTSGVATVRIDNFTFTPAEITIAPGTTVTWSNGDDIPHAVAASNKAFRSKVMDTDEKFSFTFKNAGTYDYFCSIHPHMQGKIIVK